MATSRGCGKAVIRQARMLERQTAAIENTEASTVHRHMLEASQENSLGSEDTTDFSRRIKSAPYVPGFMSDSQDSSQPVTSEVCSAATPSYIDGESLTPSLVEGIDRMPMLDSLGTPDYYDVGGTDKSAAVSRQRSAKESQGAGLLQRASSSTRSQKTLSVAISRDDKVTETIVSAAVIAKTKAQSHSVDGVATSERQAKSSTAAKIAKRRRNEAKASSSAVKAAQRRSARQRRRPNRYVDVV